MRLFYIITIMLLFCSSARGQQAEQIKLKDLQQLINKPSDKVQVINFWATWCAPCVKEIPFLKR